MLVYVNFMANRYVDDRIASDIEQGQERIAAAEKQRIDSLRLTASLVASFPALKALLENTDSATVRDFLINYQQQYSRSELFAVFDRQQRVVARTDQPEPQPIVLNRNATVLTLDSGTYHMAVAAAEAGGTIFGYVLAGARIDDEFARVLHETTNDDVVIVDEHVLGSSLSPTNLPWRTRTEWASAAGGDGVRTLAIGGETFEAVSTLLGTEGDPRPMVVIMQSHDRAMSPYRRIQFGLLALGLAAAVAGIAGSAAFARNVTAPVAKLAEGTKAVSAGNFDYRLDVQSNDEIGDLARSFNGMIQGLRERTDMEKYVSQSTVDMIQATTQKQISAGEKVVLTVFFSDMRGFTAMTEHKQPEETVKLLNDCLRLQAARVHKFHGDIDKYVGDCVVALFRSEDMELDAIRCAVEIQKALAAFNASRPNEAPLQVGIGIVTGEVVLGSIGSEDRQDYTVIGSNVNLCSRLCSKAGPGEILLSESTYARVSGLIGAEKLEPIQVKGFTNPIPVYRMASARVSI